MVLLANWLQCYAVLVGASRLSWEAWVPFYFLLFLRLGPLWPLYPLRVCFGYDISVVIPYGYRRL